MADTGHPIVIVGAGASGLMAAVAASRARSRRVLLLEKQPRVGRKLLATGNGRCNLMNLRPGDNRYHGEGAAAAQAMLRRTSPVALRKRFVELGLYCREEDEGRVYPASGQAGAVLDVLRAACERQGVMTRCDTRVSQIEPASDGFIIRLQQGETVRAARVVLATGGMAAPALGGSDDGYALLRPLGHRITPHMPALAPLKLPTDRIRGLKGVRVRAGLTLCINGEPVRSEAGEVLFTDYGVSGVAAMQLARDAGEAIAHHRDVSLVIGLLGEDAARAQVDLRATLFAGEPMERFFTGLLHPRVGLCLLREAGVTPASPVEERSARAMALLLSEWRLPVTGVLPFAHAQCTAGGAAFDAFDPETLESRAVPGLFTCGEVLDVDGDCGGYNLMWAWLSGWTAGENAAIGAG